MQEYKGFNRIYDKSFFNNLLFGFTGINIKEYRNPHHLVLLLFKFDKEKPNKNFKEESRIFGKQPEAGNIFIVKNPEKEVPLSCSCGRVRKPDKYDDQKITGQGLI